MPTILHVDMDAFYASIEQRERPELRGKPVAVGGSGPRSVVAAASYEARTFGVRSAMPMMRARRMCPSLHVVPPDFDLYGAESNAIRAIFERFTWKIEPLSLDEAFLDVPGDGVAAASSIRAAVKEERGLAASVGVAAVKFLAKIASRKAKPDGLLVIPEGAEVGFLHPLPVSELWGVGGKTAAVLQQLGIGTIGQLAETPAETLSRRLGPAAGEHLHDLAWGRDPRPVETDSVRKSISVETTFDRDLTDDDSIGRELVRLADALAARVRKAETAGRTIVLKLRRSDFTTITRSRTLPRATDVSAEMLDVAKQLYASLGWRTPRVRLLGLGLHGLTEGSAPLQLSLEGADWGAVDRAGDVVRRRFGDDALTRARLHPAGRPDPPRSV